MAYENLEAELKVSYPAGHERDSLPVADHHQDNFAKQTAVGHECSSLPANRSNQPTQRRDAELLSPAMEHPVTVRADQSKIAQLSPLAWS
tara:strand:- start:158 stop:427 length:270 start_codon:yes stop_codon:yes gene_type:complete